MNQCPHPFASCPARGLVAPPGLPTDRAQGRPCMHIRNSICYCRYLGSSAVSAPTAVLSAESPSQPRLGTHDHAHLMSFMAESASPRMILGDVRRRSRWRSRALLAASGQERWDNQSQSAEGSVGIKVAHTFADVPVTLRRPLCNSSCCCNSRRHCKTVLAPGTKMICRPCLQHGRSSGHAWQWTMLGPQNNLRRLLPGLALLLM